jgi:hypothetical protein
MVVQNLIYIFYIYPVLYTLDTNKDDHNIIVKLCNSCDALHQATCLAIQSKLPSVGPIIASTSFGPLSSKPLVHSAEHFQKMKMPKNISYVHFGHIIE